jgi:hypothetical protein
MNKIYTWVLFLLLIGNFSACDIRDNETAPDFSFTKIYDNGEFERAYYPLDIKQTADSGYIILGAATIDDSSFPGVYLLKIDEKGEFEWESLSSQYVYPASALMSTGNGWSFFCMDKGNLGGYLMQADSLMKPIRSLDAEYPLAGSQIQGGYLLQSYNRYDRKTKLTRMNGSGSTVWTKEYDIFEKVEEDIVYHMTRQTRPLPFFTGLTPGGQVYFNGFNNYTLALTFVNGGNGEQTGVVNGTRYRSGISSVEPLSGNTYALARYKEDGENIYIPQGALSPSATGTAKAMEGNELPELTKQARVIIRKGVVNGKSIVWYASDTKNGQISLFAYEEVSGALLATKYLGAGNKFEIGGFTFTKDDGLIVVGRTFAAGRFPRLCVFKLSKSAVDGLFSSASSDK